MSRNHDADDIDRALGFLESYNAARMETDPPKRGRPTERWYATEDDETDELNEISPDVDGVGDINSFNSSVSKATDESGWGQVV